MPSLGSRPSIQARRSGGRTWRRPFARIDLVAAQRPACRGIAYLQVAERRHRLSTERILASRIERPKGGSASDRFGRRHVPRFSATEGSGPPNPAVQLSWILPCYVRYHLFLLKTKAGPVELEVPELGSDGFCIPTQRGTSVLYSAIRKKA